MEENVTSAHVVLFSSSFFFFFFLLFFLNILATFLATVALFFNQNFNRSNAHIYRTLVRARDMASEGVIMIIIKRRRRMEYLLSANL